MPTNQTNAKQLLQIYLRPQWKTVLLLALLVLGGLAIQLINPQVMRRFLDGAEQDASVTVLRQLAIVFLVLAGLNQLLRLAGSYVAELVAWTATNALRADLAEHCLRLDMGFHKTHKPGELIERVDGDINKLAAFFSRLVVQMTANLILTVAVLTLLFSIDWAIGLSITLIFIVGIVVVRVLNGYAIPRMQALRETEATLFGYIEEWLNGTETIRSNSAETFIMYRLYDQLRERWHRGHASMRIGAAMNIVPNSVFSLAYVALFTLGAWRYADGAISLGTIYIVIYYIDVIRDPLWALTRQIEQLQRAQASINRINELLVEQPTIVDAPSPALLPTTTRGLRIQADALKFAYADEPETVVLNDINFTLNPGRILGLLGRTGSGKTTLTKLLLRFYDATEGAIRLGNDIEQVDLRTLQQSDLRHQVGVVTQQVQLFNASVRDNLTLFDKDIDDERIHAALSAVGLDTWLSELPDGLDSHLAADGGLSAGEAQLLAFTRVFLDDPQLVILDEASSRLDPATEQRMEHALDTLLQNRTVVIVAHRLETVLRADEIMILEQGEIVEYGEREGLMADADSRFSQLLRTGLAEAIA